MGYFSDAYDLSGAASSGFGGYLPQMAEGTPNTSDGGFFGMLQDAVKTGVSGYIAVRQAQQSGSQPETTYDPRIVPDTNYVQAQQQALGGLPTWALVLGGVAILGLGILLLKD